MTTALGIAAVTATLRSLLSEGLVEHNLSGVLGSTATVSVLPPDRVVPQNGTEASQLNLFLHRVSANTGWRNEGLPSRDASGRNRLSNAPLALDLHYLLSAYSGGDHLWYSESPFAPSDARSTEDDGYLVTLAWNPVEVRSEIQVFDCLGARLVRLGVRLHRQAEQRMALLMGCFLQRVEKAHGRVASQARGSVSWER